MNGNRSRTTPGHAAILQMIAAIPRGRVASYGEIAARAGLPGRARLVGRILRESPADAALPWFRVLRADGRIAFAEGSRAYQEQVRRLAAEGVLVHRGRVDRASSGWRGNLDDLLWGPPQQAKPRPSGAKRASRPRQTAAGTSSKD